MSAAHYSQHESGMRKLSFTPACQPKAQPGQFCQLTFPQIVAFVILTQPLSGPGRTATWSDNYITLEDVFIHMSTRVPPLLRYELPMWRKPDPNATEFSSEIELCPSM